MAPVPCTRPGARACHPSRTGAPAPRRPTPRRAQRAASFRAVGCRLRPRLHQLYRRRHGVGESPAQRDRPDGVGPQRRTTVGRIARRAPSEFGAPPHSQRLRLTRTCGGQVGHHVSRCFRSSRTSKCVYEVPRPRLAKVIPGNPRLELCITEHIHWRFQLCEETMRRLTAFT
jgi:hypothetical protein